jgi:hypothetical protein
MDNFRIKTMDSLQLGLIKEGLIPKTARGQLNRPQAVFSRRA